MPPPPPPPPPPHLLSRFTAMCNFSLSIHFISPHLDHTLIPTTRSTSLAEVNVYFRVMFAFNFQPSAIQGGVSGDKCGQVSQKGREKEIYCNSAPGTSTMRDGPQLVSFHCKTSSTMDQQPLITGISKYSPPPPPYSYCLHK